MRYTSSRRSSTRMLSGCLRCLSQRSICSWSWSMLVEVTCYILSKPRVDSKNRMQSTYSSRSVLDWVTSTVDPSCTETSNWIISCWMFMMVSRSLISACHELSRKIKRLRSSVARQLILHLKSYQTRVIKGIIVTFGV